MKKKQKNSIFANIKVKFKTNVIFRYSTTFILFLLLTILMLYISAIIPKNLIYDNVVKSLDYFEKFRYKQAFKFHKYSLLEGSGDVRNISIAYEMDSKEPIDSIIRLKFQKDISNLIDMKDTFVNRKGEVINYSRYWRGQAMYSKIMLVFMNLKYTHIFQLAVMICLVAILTYKLFKESKTLSISFIVMNISINAFFTAFSVEYFFSILIAYIMSIIVINLYKKESIYIGIMFAISGIVTCVFDVLTCETLTLTLPLFIYVFLNIKDNKKIDIKDVLKYILIWLTFYVLTFLTKWFITCFYLGFDYFPKILNAMINRMGYNGLPFYVTYWKAIIRSLHTLLPFYYIKNGEYVVIALVLLCIIKVLKNNNNKYMLLLLIALLPLGRYLVLISHGYTFYYYTYRAFGTLILFISSMILGKPHIFSIPKNKNE